MSTFSGDETAPFFGLLGAAAAFLFSCMGAAYGTAKSGVGAASLGVMRPEMVMKSIVPVVMAGVLGIYGLIIALIISTGINPKAKPYYLFDGYAHLSLGLACGLAGLSAGMAIGIFGDADVRIFYMEKKSNIKRSTLERLWGFSRKCLFLVLSFGPMPNHIAFIMDGNRRFSKNRSIKQSNGHKVGYAALVSTLRYCYEMGVKYVTVYAFSIDNFKRKPDEVHSLMTLMQEKIDELLKEESIVNQYGIRINFWGNLKLLNESVRLAAKKAMANTAMNTGPVLSVCVAYTSTDEIMHSVEESCAEKIIKIQEGYASNGCVDDMKGHISLADLDQHLYTADCPDPDIVIRTSGETRMSNFLLWQTTFSHLQNPDPLWPEFSLRHLVCAILEYQRVYSYLEELRSKSKKRH